HLLRQALAPLEAAAGEALADARRLEDVEIVKEPLRAGRDVVERVAAQQNRDVVLLEDGVVRVAREADRRQQRVLARSPVERRVLGPGGRDPALEVRQPP